MIICIPFSKNIVNYMVLSDKLRAYGPYQSHSLYVISEASESEDATEFNDSIRDMFHSAALVFLPPADRTKIKLANDMFLKAAEMAWKHETTAGEVNGAPFMYYDPTGAPCAKEWAELVQVEWFKAGKKVLGCTVKGDDVNVVTRGQKVSIPGGVIFKNAIVINKDFWSSSGLVNFLAPNIHWRDSLRYELSSSHAVSTTLSRGLHGLIKTIRNPKVHDYSDNLKSPKIPEPPKE